MSRMRKAVAGALMAGLAAGVTGYLQARPDGVTDSEWGTLAGAAVSALVLAFAAVYRVPNADPDKPAAR